MHYWSPFDLMALQMHPQTFNTNSCELVLSFRVHPLSYEPKQCLRASLQLVLPLAGKAASSKAPVSAPTLAPAFYSVHHDVTWYEIDTPRPGMNYHVASIPLHLSHICGLSLYDRLCLFIYNRLASLLGGSEMNLGTNGPRKQELFNF